MTPADSLSRARAAAVVPDTLTLRHSLTGTVEAPLEYVRSLAYASDGTLYAADARAATVHVFDREGNVVRVVRSELFSFPYLAGARGDSAVVFSPGRGRLQVIRRDGVSDAAETPSDLPPDGLLQYAHLAGKGLFMKLLGDDFNGYVGVLDRNGSLVRVADLPGPAWRRAGFLRSWGDTLLSLSGYRPVVDLVLPDGSVDSLRLVGFDSPMLSRLHLFERGEVDAPPLLSAAAVALDGNLYVLNMRPGWLQVDVYDRDGQLTAILTQPDPGFNRDYYPTDIAATAVPGNPATRIAVSVVRPTARIDVYDWVPSQAQD